MGVGNAPVIRRNLMNAGANGSTPVVIVENGTHESERAVATTLQALSECVDRLCISGPAVIFIGLEWQEAGLQRPDSVILYNRQARSGSRSDLPTVCAEAFR
jgi:siroheme synthase